MPCPPAWTIGEKLSEKGASDNLGPGCYNPIHASSSPQFSFSGSKSQALSSSRPIFKPVPETPGPGAYGVPISPIIDKTRSFSLSGSHSMNLNPDAVATPPPGHYNPLQRNKSPTFSFSCSQRRPLSESCSPGPGFYSPEKPSPRKTGGVFSKGKRAYKWTSSESPPPGAYQPRKYDTVLTYSFSRLRRPTEGNDNPGPGACHPRSRSSSPAFRVGKSYRPPLSYAEKEGTPGPGSYHSEVKKNRILSAFTKERRKEPKFNDSPGPGTYDLKPKAQKRAHKFTGSHSQNLNKDIVSNPGPGSYNPMKMRDSSPNFSAGKRLPLATESVKHNFPGPGSYASGKASSSRSVRFGSERRKTPKIPEVPGPGKYEAKIRSDSRTFSFSRKSRQPNLNASGLDSPGPGAYNAQRSSLSPAFRISLKRELLADSVKNAFPGPGTYLSDDSKKRPGSPNWTFSRERRPSFKANEVPGPGSYDAKKSSHSKASKFLKGGHSLNLCQDALDTPGPGFYDIPPAVPLPLKYR